jgi:hypothetical protein
VDNYLEEGGMLQVFGIGWVFFVELGEEIHPVSF